MSLTDYSQQYFDGNANLAKLAEDFAYHSDKLNEATTRLRFIDELFFNCLGWDKSDCETETFHGGDYTDYTFSSPRPLLIVEAKREGNYIELPAGITNVEYRIPTLIHDYPNLKAALEQVATYCQQRGVMFAAVANGHQLVAFVAVRHDGPPLEGRALVFPSLASMLMNFQQLWDAVSKPAIQNKLLEKTLLGNTVPAIPRKLSSTIPGYPGNKQRNPFQADLQIISEIILEDIIKAPELEESFLAECYSESGALSDYSVLNRNILQARYEALFNSQNPGPVTIPAVSKSGISQDLVADSLSRRPIVILGDVGVGKSIFLRHLVKISAAEQFKNSIALHLNFGSQATLSSDLKVFVVSEITQQLRANYGIDLYEDTFVRGVLE